jgi:glycerate 2-kinase
MANATLERLRKDALAIFGAGVAAADPTQAVRRKIREEADGTLRVGDTLVAAPQKLRVIAVGKAASTLAQAIVSQLPEDVFRGDGIIVANRENAREVAGFRLFGSGHPLPDAVGVQGAEAIEQYVSQAAPGDVLLVLLSGGGSAILPAPAAGVSLAEKVTVTDGLLRSGADIWELNTVRKHLSRLKGGGLACAAAPATIETLIISDVIDDDLSTIASGPTVPDPTTFADAREILERHGVWDSAPASVQQRFADGARGNVADTPGPGDPLFARAHHHILASNRRSLEAVCNRATALGYEVVVSSDALVGEARDAARFFAKQAQSGSPSRRAIVAGGETTVTVRGSGRGGRNQEMALAFALEQERSPGRDVDTWTFLSAGTDGIDGPTDAAGGQVDGGTLARARTAGLVPENMLADNDSYTLLDATGDLLRPGATGTNVADLQVFLSDAEILLPSHASNRDHGSP